MKTHAQAEPLLPAGLPAPGSSRRWYRFSKLARRNRAGLIAVGLASVALIAGTGVSVWQAVRATRAERRATGALEETRLVVDYLVNVFGAAAPEKTAGRSLTIHDLLAAGETVIPARFGRQPLVEAIAREALGRAYYDLGRYDQAATQFRRVADLRVLYLGADRSETLAAQELIVRALCPQGVTGPSKPAEAEPVARRVLEASRRTLGPEHPRTLAAMTALAHVLTVKLSQAFNEEAKRDPMLRLPDHVIRAKGLVPMEEARVLLVGAYAGQSRRLGPAHSDALETLDTLGRALWNKADYAGAEAALRQAVDGRRLVLGAAHTATLQSLKSLGDTLRRLGRDGEALQLYLEVAEGHRETFGLTHIQTSSALGRVIQTLQRAGDGARLRDLCERWLRDTLASPIDPDPFQRSRRAIQLGHLALTLTTTLPATVAFDAELAVRAAEEAAAVDRGWYSWTMLGAVQCRTGRLDQALDAIQTAARQQDWGGGNDLYWHVAAALHARRGDLARARECDKRGRAPETKPDSWTEIVDAFRDEAAALLSVAPHAGESKEQLTHKATGPSG
jgi:tetratricopeptide (TPR) repeat protein